jgi:hypothetical protein
LLLFAAGPVLAEPEAEHAFAKAFLGGIQDRSFRTGRELCGYFGYDKSGKLVATKPQLGEATTCQPRRIPRYLDIFASYHTHGVFDPQSDNEVPSVQDVQGDMSDDMNGYLSTPGGRFWFIDGETGVSHLLCGKACLAVDGGFRVDPDLPVRNSFTLNQLRKRQED